MTGLLLVDDDEVERAGREAVLARAGYRVDAVAWSELDGVGPIEGARGATEATVPGPAPRSSAGPVTALVVVRRDLTAWDRFHDLRTSSLRSVAGEGRCVAAMEASWLAEPLVRSRLASAGIDEVVPLEGLRSAAEVTGVVSGTTTGLPAGPSLDDLARRRVGRRTNPARVVERLLELAEVDSAYLRAFDPSRQQNECGLSRRRAHTLRVKVAEIGDLRPSHDHQTGGPLVDRSLPRWTEMVEFVNRCRGWDADDEEDVQEVLAS